MGYILLDKVAFNNNVKFYSKLLNSKDKICLVLKDNAYGHGIEIIASFASTIGIKHTLVRDIYEARECPATNILAASIRSVEHINQVAKYASIATCPPKIIWEIFKHKLTLQGVERFMNDWKGYDGEFRDGT